MECVITTGAGHSVAPSEPERGTPMPRLCGVEFVRWIRPAGYSESHDGDR